MKKKWGGSLSQGVRTFRIVDFDGREQTVSLWGSGGSGWSARHHELGESNEVEFGHRELRIGRDASSDIVLRDPNVASHHCRISEEDGVMIVRDRGFGVRLNGRRCIEPTPLQEGDQIEVGSSLIELLRGHSQFDVDRVPGRIFHRPQSWTQGDEERQLERYHKLRQRACLWSERGRQRRRLLAEKGVDDAGELRDCVDFEELVIEFVEASGASHRRRQVLASVAVGLVPSLLLSAYLLAPVLSCGAGGESKPEVSGGGENSPPPVEDLGGDLNDPVGQAATPCEWRQHKVIEIDTLDSLALDYGVQKEEIIRANDLDRGRLGLTIHLCSTVPEIARSKQIHTVVDGDTVESIAASYDESPAFLRRQFGARKLVDGEALEFWARQKYSRKGDEPVPLILQSNAEAIGSPNEGSLRDGVLLESDGSYEIRCSMNAYVSSYTYKKLDYALRRMRVNYDYKGELIVGDISRKLGGPYGRHLSHQNGRDVDLWLPIKGGRYRRGHDCGACGTPWCRPDPSEVNWAVTWQLIDSLREGGAVQGIFIDKSLMGALVDGAVRAGADRSAVKAIVQSGGALVSHAANHEHHIHVRYRCGPDEAECVERVVRK